MSNVEKLIQSTGKMHQISGKITDEVFIRLNIALNKHGVNRGKFVASAILDGIEKLEGVEIFEDTLDGDADGSESSEEAPVDEEHAFAT